MVRPVRTLPLAFLFFSLPLMLPGCPFTVTNEDPVVLWQGVRYDWNELSHRIAYLESSVGEPAADGSFDAGLGIIGGNFSTGGFGSDIPAWTMRWSNVDSELLAAAPVDVPFAIGPTGRADLTESIDLAALDLDAWPNHHLVLRGVTFDTDVPPEPGADPGYDVSHGWTPQRFGAGVDASPTIDDGIMTANLFMEFKAGPLDRPPMNASVPFANVAGILHLTVLGSRGPSATSGTLSAYDYILRDAPYTVIDPLPVEERTLTLAGAEGGAAALGIPLFYSFRWVLNESIGREGRYLRAFGVSLESWEYDADLGTGTGVWDLFCSHSSLVEEGDLEVAFEVQAGLLQIPDNEGSVSLVSSTNVSGVGPEGWRCAADGTCTLVEPAPAEGDDDDSAE